MNSNIVFVSTCPMKPGTMVGAGRWPEPLHAGIAPHRGVVLAVNDPLAWANTLAFAGVPSQADVDAHVAAIQKDGALDIVPVLWDFSGTGGGSRVFWERWLPGGATHSLKPYAEDLALWQMATQAKARHVA